EHEEAHVEKDLPAWDEEKHTIDSYYWYHATHALFQYDGPAGKHWKQWNGAMKDALVPHQKTTKDGCEDGSWDPALDRWGFEGGREEVRGQSARGLAELSPFPPSEGGRRGGGGVGRRRAGQVLGDARQALRQPGGARSAVAREICARDRP